MSVKTRLFASLGFLLLVAAVMAVAPLFDTHLQELETALGILSVIIILIVLFSVQQQLFNPLEAIGNYADAVSSGKKGVKLDGTFPAELAYIKDGLEKMVHGLEEANQAVQESQAVTKRQAEDNKEAFLQCSIKENACNKLLSDMNAAAAKAGSVSTQIFDAIRELTEMTGKVQEGVDVQRDRMTETATAMEEMSGTVREIAMNASGASESAELSKENAQTGAEGVRDAVSSISRVQEQILGLKESMAELGGQADNIGKIITVINDIADQTNLLALNAAIEAARAGEAGRGFAVVADEVRKLAEKTMSATKEVGDAVRLIQQHAQTNVHAVDTAAENIVQSAEVASESGGRMEQIVDIVDNTALQVASIATASEEQSAASEEINMAVMDVTRVAQDTADEMERSSAALVAISGMVEDLDSIIQGMATGRMESAVSDKLVEWSDSLSVGVKQIDDQHKMLVNMINDLHQAMRQRRAKEVLLDLVGKLADYTVTHFGTEEKLFDKYGYPDTAKHKEIHAKFVAKVQETAEQLRAGTATVSMDLMRFLKDWLVGHIQGTDKKYTEFLHSKGVR